MILWLDYKNVNSLKNSEMYLILKIIDILDDFLHYQILWRCVFLNYSEFLFFIWLRDSRFLNYESYTKYMLKLPLYRQQLYLVKTSKLEL